VDHNAHTNAAQLQPDTRARPSLLDHEKSEGHGELLLLLSPASGKMVAVAMVKWPVVAAGRRIVFRLLQKAGKGHKAGKQVAAGGTVYLSCG
jgi:hypothetical protein